MDPWRAFNEANKFFKNNRWDSSDPERAPPPLPLNPGTASPATKPNTSAVIAAAAEALTTKSRESAYTTNPAPNRSPERSLIKGQIHKRMQSMHNGQGSIRDRNPYFDGTSSLERSAEKIPRSPMFDYENRSPEKSPTRTGTPTTPTAKDFVRDAPILRPASRPQPKAILGENTPPPSTMLALQNTNTPKETDTSLSNITNGSSAMVRAPQSIEALSSQILSLTSIATNLQREMAQLSRRSKDNATDLISLKEATNLRDEDIRTSLRDLVNNLSSQLINSEADASSRSTSHYSRGPGTYLLENKAHGSPSGMPKSYSLPRIPSPNSFAGLDREIVPSPYSMDGAASIALLEKVLREMGTKEGQERLFSTLSELHDRSKIKDSDPAISKKLEEILAFLKDGHNRKVVVPRLENGNSIGDRAPKLELEFDPRSMSLARISRENTPQSGQELSVEPRIVQPTPGAAAGFVSEDILKMLKKMKDSITEGGGMTAELKALVRELRGEVLGMGREIGRKLDQAELNQSQHNLKGDVGREEMTKIVEQGLFELKGHMENVMREVRRQSSALAITRSNEDVQEVYTVVKKAMNEFPFEQRLALQNPKPGIEREDILEAIRHAWETYKPEIELQNFGLERDEILQCLKEGLEQYQPKEQSQDPVGASYEEVLEAVHEGLKHFNPPAPIVPEPSITKDEILEAVRECLDTFDFPMPNVATREVDLTREDVLEAVKEGVGAQGQSLKGFEFSREDMFETVRAGVDEGLSEQGQISKGYMHEAVRAGVEDVLSVHAQLSKDDLHEAVGAGVEHILSVQGQLSKDDIHEAVRAGVEEILSAQGQISKDVHEAVRAGVEDGLSVQAQISKDDMHDAVRAGVEELLSLQGQKSKEDIYEAVRAGIEEGIPGQALIPKGAELSRDDIFDAVKAGLDESHQPINGVGEQVLDKMQDILDGMKIEFKQYSTANGGDTEQVLDALKDGLESLRENLTVNNREVLEAFTDGFEGLKVDVERMANKPVDMTVSYEILDTLKEGLANIRYDFDRSRTAEDETSTIRGGEVVIAYPPEARGSADAASDFGMGSSAKENVAILEGLLREVCANVDDIRDRTMADDIGDKVRKSDIDTLVTLCLDTKVSVEDAKAHIEDAKAHIEDLVMPDMDHLPTKSDFEDGLDGLRAEIERIVNKPLDMTVNYEILDTLKEGLANIRADLDRARSIEEEITESKGGEVVIADGKARRDMDAMDEFGIGSTPKQELGILEAQLKEVFAILEAIRDKVMEDGDGDKVRKSDIKALETLCMQTRIHIDELSLPEVDTLPTKSEIDALGDLIRDLGERRAEDSDLSGRAFEARKIEHGRLADKIEEVKLFLDDVRAELKAKLNEDGDHIQELSKTLETFAETVMGSDAIPLVTELKEVVTREFESIQGLFAGSELGTEQKHNSLLEKHEEHKATIISELHTKIDERFDEIMTKYDDAQISAEEKEKVLEETTLQQTETLNTTKTVVEELRLLINTLGSTFTESCEQLGDDSKTVFGRIEEIGSKIDSLLALNEKNEHHSTREEVSESLTGLEGNLRSKIDERFDEIMTKYDDAQIAAEEKDKSFRETALQQTDSLNTTARSGAEELRTLVDTLGSTIIDRMDGDTSAVVEHIQNLVSKIDGLLSIDQISEHQSTRAEVSKTLTGVEGVQAHVTEYQPKILEAIKEVLGIVGQHYQQAKTSTEEIKSSVQAIPAAIPLPAIAATPPAIEFPVHETYDDSTINAKLDQLIGHAEQADKSLAQFVSLDQIREQVTAIAKDFSEYITGQQTAIARVANDRAREAEEVAVALQMRISQKDNVEAEIARASAQKDEIAQAVHQLAREKEDLMLEKENLIRDNKYLAREKESLIHDKELLMHDKVDLTAQKSKLQVDLSSLHTALSIRREELHIIEERAGSVERSILDGVLDHSRSLLAISTRPRSSLKDMNLKRVVSTTSNATENTSTSTISPTLPHTVSAVSSGIGMALKRRQPTKNGSLSGRTTGDRRILSLSTLGANRNANADRSLVLTNSSHLESIAKGSAFGGGGLKRSHSVKSNFPVRKTSWGGTKALGMYGDEGPTDEEDKENSVLTEEDEDEEGSETGTERRTSYTGTYTDTMSYGTGSVVSSDGRRTSYAPSIVDTIGTKDYPITEDGHGEESEGESIDGEEEEHEPTDARALILYGQGSEISASTGLEE